MSSFAHLRKPTLAAIVVVLASAAFGTVVAWQAPGLGRYSRDWLVRVRGPVPVSSEIAIVAIDDVSIAQIGGFPWSRAIIAQAVDAIAAAQPKAIALDVLFTDGTSTADDEALAEAIDRAGNVILASQLIDRGVYGEHARWLMPLPALAAKAAATGHVNVGTESDGSARQMLVEQSDDLGDIIRALPIETFRVANRIPEHAIVDGWREFVIGPRSIPVDSHANPLSGPLRHRRVATMQIDYAGPSGAFAAQQYGISEVINGKLPAGALRGKFVLVGSTAASLGERFASPFVHYADAQGNQHGASMPGVEVLANALNTIVSGRFYLEMPDLAAFIFAAAAAGLMISLLAFAWGSSTMLRFVVSMALGLAIILGASYFCLTQLLIFPAVVAALASFGSAGVSSLAIRSVQASKGLDRGIQRVLDSLRSFETNLSPAAAMESIVRLTGVTGALLLQSHRVLGSYGYPASVRENFPEDPILSPAVLLTKIPLRGDFRLILVHPASNLPSRRSERLAQALAMANVNALPDPEKSHRAILPDALEDKTGTIVRLNQRIARQAEFFYASMRAVEDGLLIAAPDGSILFANPRAASIFNLAPNVLTERNLFDILPLAEPFKSVPAPELLESLVLDRHVVERELTLRLHRYALSLAPVILGEGDGQTAGIVASLSDITRQHELAQVRSDVVTLVSHEMRTPLTAIQGMTELLANYEIEPFRRKEMTLAINDEVKRLARMIGDYLDIASLEMGKTSLRMAPLHLESVVERTLLLFEPLAKEKSIRLVRNFDDSLRPMLGDSDLLSRVFSNLVSNAIKYSPADTEIKVSTFGGTDQVCLAVEDQGYGIPAEDIERIFEKFYRVPRLQDADVSGTGLGLTFVREIVELHGGVVSARSMPSEGSVFTVYLPSGPVSQIR